MGRNSLKIVCDPNNNQISYYFKNEKGVWMVLSGDSPLSRQYYTDTTMKDRAKEIAENQIIGMCDKQFVILCTIPDYLSSKNETLEFLRYIKSAIPDLYKDIPGKKNKLLIWSKVLLFPVVHKMYLAKYS